MLQLSNEESAARILLCTIPLDSGIPRGAKDLPIVPKIAIVSLIKWMEKHGYTREQYDFYDIDMLDSSDEKIRAYFREYNPNVLGLSATVSTTYGIVKRIAAIAREECPNAWIILGGSLSASARVVLHKTEVDICIQGDGEIPWVEFLGYRGQYGREWEYSQLAKIKGLTYLDPNGEMQFSGYPESIPATENPYPDYELLKIGIKTKPEALEYYFRDAAPSSWFQSDPRTFEPDRRPKMAALWTTKGCVARCTFCQRSIRGFRRNSVTTLDEHLEELKEKYNVGFIQISDENFGADKKHAYEVARMMKRHDMLWMAGGVRCLSIDGDDVKFYQEHGCSALKFGIESGSQMILDLMEKNFTVEQVYQAVRHCYVNDMYSPLAVMTGMPGENDETARQTGEFLGNMARMGGVPPAEMGLAVFYALPLPGTPLYEYGQHVGVIGTTVDDEEKYLIAISDLGADKSNYININGSSLRDLLFWDFLILYEATRTYYSRSLGTDRVTHSNLEIRTDRLPAEIHGVDLERRERERLYPAMGDLAYRTLKASRHPITTLNNKLTRRPLVAKLPRVVVYFTMRNLLYLEFLVVKACRVLARIFGVRLRPRNLYNDHKLPQPITDEILSERRNDRSLRTIVKLKRDESPTPDTITDRNQQILVQGR